jgi:trans-aconitate 2-methyltransferase
MWDAQQYLRYADERSRPFVDLTARVLAQEVRSIVDLGCGPGNLTRTLIKRWPDSHILGVDNSQEMLDQARPLAIPGRMEFVHGDIASWSADEPIDCVVSNAALQWVADHGTLLTRLAKLLSPTGTLAVQMPYHFENPAHLVIEAAKNGPRWRQWLQGVGLNQQSVSPLTWYVEHLHSLGMTVDAWQTTYIHVLSGPNPVLEWFKGSALRPLLKALPPQEREAFLRDIGSRFDSAYPAKNGVTLLAFPRIFFVAGRSG